MDFAAPAVRHSEAMSVCMLAKAGLGLGLGLLLRLDPLLAPLGLGFDALAPGLAAARPFNGGTGFFVSGDGAFVAPYHVLGDCPRPALQTPSGLVVGEIVAASATYDIVVARAAAAPRQFAAFAAESRLGLGEPLAIASYRGCGGLDSRAITQATALPLPGDGAVALAAAAPIRGGNSGSPVIDAAGAVVGMLIARANAAASTGYAVDGATLKGFLLGAGVAIDIVPERLPLPEGLAGALASQYTFPALCLY